MRIEKAKRVKRVESFIDIDGYLHVFLFDKKNNMLEHWCRKATDEDALLLFRKAQKFFASKKGQRRLLVGEHQNGK